MTTSGTYAFDPTYVDIVLDAFDRVEIRPSALTPDHMFSARRSINQLLVRFANRGINLWAVDEQTVTLNTGQSLYNCPSSTVAMLETWVRQYQMNSPESTPPSVSTTITSTIVEVTLADHGLSVGYWTSIPIYVSVGGIVLQGFYQVTTVTGANTFTITASDAATATVSGGGAVPVYDTTSGSDTVTVTLADHGFAGGETYTVHVLTEVGGLSLQGDYIVQTVPTANTLTISAGYDAGSTATASENDGEMQIATQDSNVNPTDRILAPISRTDWAAIPQKTLQGGWPTTYYFDRTSPTPSFNLWQVPDGSVFPQELHYYRMRQLQDADPQSSQTADVPYRFQEALCSGLAYMLAIKWKTDKAADLKAYFEECWSEAASEDRERVVLNLSPMTDSYYR